MPYNGENFEIRIFYVKEVDACSLGGTLATPVLMFMNMKGGVGKTTLAVEISRTLAYNYEKNVLLIDYDPQSNASLAFLDAARYFQLRDAGKSLADCLMPGSQSTDPFSVVKTVASGEVDVATYSVRVRGRNNPGNVGRKLGSLDIVPGNLDLMRLALNVLGSETENRLLSRWNGLLASAKDFYDCVVVDCHPAGSFFTKSALLASNAVIIPVTSDAYAATGLRMMRQHMEMWEASGGAKEFLVVFNDAHRAWDSSVESEIRGDRRFEDNCLSNRIRYSTLLRNIPKRRQTSVEQPVSNRRKVGRNIANVTREMVGLLRNKAIFDSSWG